MRMCSGAPLSAFTATGIFCLFVFGHTIWLVGSQIPGLGIELMAPAVKTRSLNLWTTREVLPESFFVWKKFVLSD